MAARFLASTFAALLSLLVSASALSASQEVGINQVRNRSTYMLDLLKLALSYSDKEYHFTEAPERLSKLAEREAALTGKIAVFWGGTSADQERDFIPVRIDGYRGLMSLRFLIIRAQDQAEFSKINTLAQLQAVTMGQGRGWRDGQILEASGITVARSTKKTGLYHMLEGERFDAFPRGATEAWVETENFSHLDLIVENHLIVRYPLPTYFFVSKKYPQLAADIEYGMLAALNDGSFDRFFYNNDRVQAFLENADLEHRRVIDLDNPYIPAESKAVVSQYMLDIDDLLDGARRLELGEFD